MVSEHTMIKVPACGVMEKEGKLMSATHFIAIGGTGMSGLAKILVEMGQEVSGSDIKESEATQRLRAMGARVYIGHRSGNIPEDANLVVVSSAISEDNPELKEAKRRHLDVVHRGEMLAWLMNSRLGIAVVGAHGKTTTTTMVGLVLEKNGLDPTVLVGGEVTDFGGNAKLGNGKYLVAEADESDGSFLKLRPHIGIITNIDDDHLDYYKSMDHLLEAFRRFVRQVKPDGAVVVCYDDENARKLIPAASQKVITYGLSPQADVTVSDVQLKDWTSRCSLVVHGDICGQLALEVPGVHNIQNALGAVATGLCLGLEPSEVSAALAGFKGVGRRQQVIGHVDGIRIIDDYAHHPTEIRTTLKAVRSAVPGRILAIFQPHRFSRTQILKDKFAHSFDQVNLLILADIYPGPGEKPVPGVTSELIQECMEPQTAEKTLYMKGWDDIVDFCARWVNPGDTVLTIGAGDIWHLAHAIKDRLNEERNQSTQ